VKEIPILMFHSLDPGRFFNKMAIPPELFKRQLKALARLKSEVIPLEACARQRGRQRLFERKVAITFDDGYRDNFEIAFPLLKQFGFPATFFVSPETLGQEGYLDWKMLREMSETPGIEIASHGLFHETLADLTSDEARQSTRVSKKILEAGLGREVRAFSYPSGSFNERVIEYVKEAGYLYACAASHLSSPAFLGNPYALRRIKISGSSAVGLMFAVRVSGFYNLFRR